ncbi:MAG TPA: hypothetical protein VLW65_15135 [Bryobacteraceae bacterium]|nr:hypothetical protein [Bryobacteraceae bacterium]
MRIFVLRTIEALGINLAVDEPGRAIGQTAPPPVDIDSIIAAAREKRK